jgi:hypothetical protein
MSQVPSPLFPRLCKALHASSACSTATGAIVPASKIGDVPLYATVGALAAVWLIAVVGLTLTIKTEYLHTFMSLQTGFADTQSYFLDNQGDDAKRINIFFMNERHWQAIRDRVRQWVLSVYATWQALLPAFFTADLQARIPDDFMPAQAVQDLNAQSRDGRRPTLQNMGLLRRMSHVAPADGASESDWGVRRPSQVPSPSSSVTDAQGTFTDNTSVLPGSAQAEPTTELVRPAATGAARPCNIEVGPPVSFAERARGAYDPPFKPDDRPDAADEDESQTLPEELPCEDSEVPKKG